MNDTLWLLDFAATAAKTDHFTGTSDHAALLAAGLIGEAGSVVAELKKKRRERDAYPVYRERMDEEVGDFLWYFVRLAAVVAPSLLDELPMPEKLMPQAAHGSQLAGHLKFGAAVGDVLAAVSASRHDDLPELMRRTWALLTEVASDADVCLRDAAARNATKTSSRWPNEKTYAPLFDNDFPVEEQLPRRLQVDFLERTRGTQRASLSTLVG